VEADAQCRCPVARGRCRLGKGGSGDQRRRRGKRACQMRLENAAIYSGREPEVVSVDDELANVGGHSVVGAGPVVTGSMGSGAR